MAARIARKLFNPPPPRPIPKARRPLDPATFPLLSSRRLGNLALKLQLNPQRQAEGKAILGELERRLLDPEAGAAVREQSADQLGRLGSASNDPSKLIAILISVLNDPDQSTSLRRKSIAALARIAAAQQDAIEPIRSAFHTRLADAATPRWIRNDCQAAFNLGRP
jgi:hypothetical protein